MKESIVRSVEGLYEQRTLELVKIAIHKGFTPLQILDWLRIGMERVGVHYEKSDYFIADLIFAGIIFQEVIALDEFQAISPVVSQQSKGKLLIASVYGDCHEIGKNIFGSFAKTAGFDVIDLGIDVPAQDIVNKAAAIMPDVIGLSGMQQETIEEMKKVVDGLTALGIRDKIRIIIGGAFIEDGKTHLAIGADYATQDVTKAVEICTQWIQEKQ
ncbi:MAG: cobalamin-dependent protein [Eubacterium sp.]|nr:cobalamin-dependent protein [Eubacterium sp.]